MIMVVLGNGFDLACGLPTSYNHYFQYRFNNLKDDFLMIEELFNPRISLAKEYFSEYTKEIRRWSHSSSKYQDASNTFMNLLKSDVDHFHLEIDKTAYKLSETNITFWDLYFYFKSKVDMKQIDLSWNSIESNIKNFLSSKDTNLSSSINNSNPIKLLNFKVNNLDSYTDSSFDNIVLNVSVKNILQTLVYYYIQHKIDDHKITDFYFSELQLFELAFSEYIKSIMMITKESHTKSQKQYRDNLIELVKHVKTNDVYILNFNYTFFETVNRNNTNNYLNSPFNIKRDGRTFKITENNVHGQYHNSIIFGIDQDKLEKVDDLYIFTKTYRKMRNQDDIPTIEIPRINDLLEIVFYGHSLSDADYSYFQSIFDYYDIYRSPIKLVFKYTNFEENDYTGGVKTKYLKSVVNLIKSYGSKMFDSNHGNNLIHKLLLENRLSIEEVQLKRIDL